MTQSLDEVRAAALELPETEERLSHGQPTFFVAGKQFAQFRDNHHGDRKTVVCVRVSSLDEQAMLLEADPETYSKPAYLPSWVSINLAGAERRLEPCRRPDRGELGACGAAALARSWRTMRRFRRPAAAGSPSAKSSRVLALVVSAAGLWLTWKSNGEDKPTRVVEQSRRSR